MHTSLGDSAGRPVPLLSVTDLAAGYGAIPIVSGISLQVAAGEIVLMVGPNGAGKSTVLKAVMGEIRCMEGSVVVGDTNVTGWPAERLARVHVGYVPQTRDVFDSLTVVENLHMGGYLLPRKAAKERLDEVLAAFPTLSHMLTRTASKLSGGERKVLGIARALMLSPKLLVLDEPTVGLSPAMSRTLLHEHVRLLARGGTAILMVEQKALAALEVADWVHVLVSGRMALSGAPDDVRARDDFGEVFLGQRARDDSEES